MCVCIVYMYTYIFNISKKFDVPKITMMHLATMEQYSKAVCDYTE